MGTELYERDRTAWRTFTSDVRLALSAWRKAPALPLVSALFPLATTGALLFGVKNADPLNFVIVAISMVLQVGWVGTERLWYLRLFRDDRLTAREAVRFTLKYIPSFAILGFVMYLTLIVLWIIVGNLADASFAAWVGMQIALVMIADVLMTFVTPSLAYSEFMVTKAIGRGLAMLRVHWKHAKFYAIVPPLAALLTAQYFAREVGAVGAVSLAVAAGLLNLWFKGATAAYYLRFNDVGRNGRFDADAGAYIDK